MSPPAHDDPHQLQRKRRVGKACDLCRVKKSKCDGKKPCSRCIADNKLCVFTKKKSKEKAHPAGYIELLETRIDLLTRSLLKIVLLAEPHIPFLQHLMELAKLDPATQVLPASEDSTFDQVSSVPINDVVAYLISNFDLLADQPLLWPDAIDAAANLLQSNVLSASQLFSRHDSELASEESTIDRRELPEHASLEKKEDPPPSGNTSPRIKTEAILPPQARAFPMHSRTNLSALIQSADDFSGFINESRSWQNFSMNGFLNSPQLESAAGLDPMTLASSEMFPQRTNLLFLNNSRGVTGLQLSLSSLSHRLENQNLDDNQRPSVRRQVSIKGLKSLAKRRNSGHVHKPPVHPHSSSSLGTLTSLLSNNANTFNFPQELAGQLPQLDLTPPQLQLADEFDGSLFLQELPSMQTPGVSSYIDEVTNPPSTYLS